MRNTPLAIIAALALSGAASAQTENDGLAVTTEDGTVVQEVEPVDPLTPRDARDVTPEQFLWTARPIVVFADSPNDPRFREQLQMLAERPDPLLERDVVIIIDTDPSAMSAWRSMLRPREFSIVVMQKDGGVGFRRPSPRDVREITRGIDNFQFRQEELRMGGG